MSCNLRRHSDHRFCCGGCDRAVSSMVEFDWHRKGQVCTDPAIDPKRFLGRVIPGAVGDVILWGENKAFPVGRVVPESTQTLKGYPDEGPTLPSPQKPIQDGQS